MNFCGFCDGKTDLGELVFVDALENRSSLDIRNRNNEQVLTLMEQFGTTMVLKSKYQQYYSQAKNSKTKFTDPEFPPNRTSLGYHHPNRKIIWKRIPEIIQNPVMIEGKIEPNDIQQGNAGDCYFLAAISSLAEVPIRIQNIFWNQMQVKPEGIYRLALNVQGKRSQIYIDDYIPVFEGSDRPVFCKSINKQIWVMLLEKAWAKLSGSYGMTSQGYPHQVFNTFSVAPCFFTEISSKSIYNETEKNLLWQKLMEGENKNLPMCCGSRKNRVCKGIKPGHTYSLLNCYQIKNERMIKLRNPWGDTEYLGKFNFNDDSFWNSIDPKMKKQIFAEGTMNNGIFMISLDQFIRNFDSLDICFDMSYLCSTNSSVKYGYQFTTINTESYKENYFSLEVPDSSDFPFYITIEKSFNRGQMLKNNEVEYGYSKVLIAKKGEDSYEYIDAKLESNFPDLTIKCPNFKKGNYIIYCETQFPKKQNGSFTLSVYGVPRAIINKIEKPDPIFLHKVFTYHAYVINQHKQYVLNSQEDWTASMFMLQAGGFGYVLINLGKDSHRKMRITCDVNQIYNNGFLILERNIKAARGEIEIEIVNGEQAIVIFGAQVNKTIESVTFPPGGLRIVRII